jgi:predicted MFS family arabinose efflux permease
VQSLKEKPELSHVDERPATLVRYTWCLGTCSPLGGFFIMETNHRERQRRNRLLWVLCGATFLIFFQAFMVAPLLPRLAQVFGVPIQTIGLIIPAYLIPYGVATLVYGPLSDRLGRRPILVGSLAAFVLLTALTATVQSAPAMLVLRLLTGLGASGVVPLALAFIGDAVPYRERGRALGWLFGAMAGGIAFGSTFGAVLEPFLSWQGLFLGVAGLSALVWVSLLPQLSALPAQPSSQAKRSFGDVLSAYGALLRERRGLRTYAYVLFTGLFHSGTFTWLGYYLKVRYGLGEVGIGLALLGYGLPGFLFGPLIGRAADHWGRSHLIPMGIAIGGAAACALALAIPLPVAVLLVTVLSLGYDMTQPLLAGIVTDLSAQRGLAMGLNVCTLFTGFGLGSLLLGTLLPLGLLAAYAIFGGAALCAALVAVPLFRMERPPRSGA